MVLCEYLPYVPTVVSGGTLATAKGYYVPEVSCRNSLVEEHAVGFASTYEVLAYKFVAGVLVA